MSEIVETGTMSTSPSDESIAAGAKKESLQVFTKPESTDSSDADPYLVSFDGPDDQSNPVNWSKGRKWCIVGLTSAMTLVV